MFSTARIWLAGPAAALLFAASLIGFAAARTDGYSHATKAVSELGAIGAPSSTAFNLFGLILPGLLIVAFALALGSASGRRVGPWLLVGSGAMLALAGIAPANMDDYQAPTTILHGLGAIGSGLFWFLALFWLGPLLRDKFALRGWATATPWFGLFLLANIGWQAASSATGLVMPGWGQRIAFAGYFLWLAVTGWLLRREAGRS